MVYDLEETLVFMHWNQMDLLLTQFSHIYCYYISQVITKKWQDNRENWSRKTAMLYSLLAVGVNMQYIFNH